MDPSCGGFSSHPLLIGMAQKRSSRSVRRHASAQFQFLYRLGIAAAHSVSSICATPIVLLILTTTQVAIYPRIHRAARITYTNHQVKDRVPPRSSVPSASWSGPESLLSQCSKEESDANGESSGSKVGVPPDLRWQLLTLDPAKLSRSALQAVGNAGVRPKAEPSANQSTEPSL